ncbi:hypothetical protein [Lentilactobacillus kisonensis]|uniref:hypothetical protein n=1 Tax=Lentilactobacillus kisonensis TaxID=481722 RepID=UPI0006D152AA|nr:hypothetical protein [Lentilactobacillus kisonensis]
MQEKEAYDILYNLSPAQFSHVRSVAKIWYVTSAPAWKPTWYEKHHVNEDYLEAVDFLVAKHGRYGMGDVLLHFENYRFPQKDLRAGTQKYFDKEFKHSKLDSLEDLMDYIERYCLDKRASRQSNQAMNKRTQPTKSIRQTTYYRRKAIFIQK